MSGSVKWEKIEPENETDEIPFDGIEMGIVEENENVTSELLSHQPRENSPEYSFDDSTNNFARNKMDNIPLRNESEEKSSKKVRSYEPLELDLDKALDSDYEENHVRILDSNRSLADFQHYAWMTNIWSTENIAIPASYFCVGLATSFIRTPLSYYMVHELGVQPDEQNVVYTLTMLPWSFKLFYGFISDNFPINGRRRKPYFTLGWTIYCVSNMILAFMERPNFRAISFLLFISINGLIFSDVVTDAIVVERSRCEPENSKGSMQATGYASRFVGSLVGSILGTCVYNRDRWGWGLTIAEIFTINGLFPVIVVLPFLFSLRETTCAATTMSQIEALKMQCKIIFETLCLKAVYIPMAVVFVFNIFQVPNAAWRSFLVEGLEFDNLDLGLISICGSMFSSFGLIAYKTYFMGTSWPKIYRLTTCLVCFFSLFQLMLIFRVNKKIGVSDLVFAMGDDSLADFVLAIQFLPIVQMYLVMCPDGTEGTTYAILTTLGNVAGSVSYSIGTLLTMIWDVRVETLGEHRYDGIWKLTLLTSLMQVVPLGLLKWLPSNAEEQKALQKSTEANSKGGIVFMVVLFLSLALTIVESLVEILK
eukprot:CAMPEP_0171455000 /NCGR_PEP_ID=MMETSP0945-20130129/2069_1 /TAXON_ID=109269 /ORGANISM="Vaucheria litorea, Strain CCMP2940" /LENGTH=592 /DNA_ID=CAMNT_0011980151 /DNA_START=81 /DNA_END=1859 /DNA_ORIENTATION=+